MRRVLIFCDYYPPGHESSGGMRTIVNTVERLGDEFDFWIVTRRHNGVDYTGLKIGDWNDFGKAKVFYTQNRSLGALKRIIESVSPSSIYCNSFFSTFTVIVVLLRRLRLIDDRIPLIIAPEGELMESALSLKRWKKAIYRKVAKLLGLYERIIWKVTSELEKRDVERLNLASKKIFIVPNMPPKKVFKDFSIHLKPVKKPKEVKLVFLSRIHPTKNLLFFLELLKHSEHKILFDVYGLSEDKSYYQRCKNLASKVNGLAEIRFKGEIKNKDVISTLLNYHFFVLPTLGENFGHVVVEALSAGCPLIISDTTPWRNLEEKRIGWDLPLDNTEKWKEVLKICVDMDDALYKEMSFKARQFIESWLKNNQIEDAMRKVLTCDQLI
ncbi:MAG: glycosyltransferase family 4 protein [Pyrinomonadaceae bacterium]|nr:glycosyltransferase family 4 protein [Pyrinomonadaceae bacterium]MCX7639797.1 glycosyltransferase family 4 protein [Pyrinomonadaceae bacterium]MDW8304380.1 glycosyltransferase family 4 protein [Acidobacteriota bacterium]